MTTMNMHAYEVWNWNSEANLTYTPETMSPTESRNQKIQYGRQAAILKMTLLKIKRLLPIYISIVPLKFEVDIQSQNKVRGWKPKKSNMAARRPVWKWRRWKSIGFCLWPPSTCIWNLKLKFQSKLDLCSWNHVVYRQTDGQTDGRTDGQGESSIPPSNFVGRGYNKVLTLLVAIMHSFLCNILEIKTILWYFLFLYKNDCIYLNFSLGSRVAIRKLTICCSISLKDIHSSEPRWILCYGCISGIDSVISNLTHCGLVTPYGDINLGQHWLR